MPSEIKGVRHPDNSLPVAPGEYSKVEGEWWVRVPVKGFPAGKLTLHVVTEHEDGTITVSPSILMDRGYDQTWHGFLEKGVWREV